MRLLKVSVPALLLAVSVSLAAQVPILEKDASKPAWPYVLPFFGADVVRQGFDLPLPFGVTVIGYWQKEDINVSGINVNLGSGPLIPADFVEFDSLKVRSNMVSARLDTWVLPVLDLYGIVGHVNSTSEVNLKRPLAMQTEVKASGTTYGFGATLAAGGKIGFVALDANYTWTSLDILHNKQQTFTFSPRVGHRFDFASKPDRHLSVWVGGLREDMRNRVQGTVSLGEAVPGISGGNLPLPPDFNQWFGSLTPAQQQNLGFLLQQVQQMIATGAIKDAVVNYDILPKAKELWSLIVGTQFELDKHWHVTIEGGFLGSRTSIMVSGSYRFGL